MKKLFYIVLILVSLILTGALFKSKTASVPTTQEEASEPQEITEQLSTEQPEISENKEAENDCVCDSECLCEEGDSDCDCSQTKSTCSCTQKDGQVVTVESIETNNEDIEELNPDETSDEDETILSE